MASSEARETVRCLLGADLLASHHTKDLDDKLAKWADLILVMASRMKAGLQPNRTCTLGSMLGTLET